MASLLDMLFGRGTPVATQDGEVVGPAGFGQGGLLGGLRNSSGSLLGFGMGMLSGQDQQEGFRNGLVGMQRGVLTDRQRQQLREAQMEKLRMQAARRGLAAKFGMDPALADVPGVQDAVLKDKLTPKDPLDIAYKQAQIDSLRRGQQPSFTEKIYSQMSPEEQAAYRRSQAGLGTDSDQIVRLREQQATRYGLTPGDPRYQSFVLTGKMPREDSQALSATDRKAIFAAEDELPLLDNTISTLERAKELNKQGFQGTGSGILGAVGTSGIPGTNVLIDRKKAEATSEFNKIMSMEAIKSMAETLKGATTDQELKRFVEILADPSTPHDMRERTINRMMKLAERQREIATSRINDLRGGTYFKPGGGGATPRPNTPPPSPENDPAGLR